MSPQELLLDLSLYEFSSRHLVYMNILKYEALVTVLVQKKCKKCDYNLWTVAPPNAARPLIDRVILGQQLHVIAIVASA